MANYICAIRTNYFGVKDVDAFKELIDSAVASDEILIFDRDFGGEKKYGFGLYGNIWGLPIDENDCDLDAFYAALQEIVAEGDAIVIEEIGLEKLRYLIAGATIITSDMVTNVSLHDAIKDEIAAMLGTNDYVLVDTY